MTERDYAIDVVHTLQKAGFRALWAGGCVRDELLGLHPSDYDVATDARPEQVMKLFRRSIAVGAAFGVIEVIGPRGPHHKHVTVEVATFRSDGAYSDGRRPDTVTFSSPEEDAKRRDFTINGMFFDPVTEEVLDFVGGREDLEARILRAIGSPIERFTEDKLRVLRAVRIAARFEMEIDPATLAAARQIAPQIKVVSAERIAAELRKLLTNSNRGRGVWLLREFGLAEPILPELALTDATIRVVERLAPPTWPRDEPVSFALAFAALLHAAGKPGALEIASRLRLSTDEKVRTAWLVEHHQALTQAPTMRLSKLKPILVHPGAGELLALHRAIDLAGGANLESVEFCERMLRDTPQEELDPPPLVTGADLIAMGLKPGPEFKQLLDAVREAQLEGAVRTEAEGRMLVARLRETPAAAPEAP